MPPPRGRRSAAAILAHVLEPTPRFCWLPHMMTVSDASLTLEPRLADLEHDTKKTANSRFILHEARSQPHSPPKLDPMIRLGGQGNSSKSHHMDIGVFTTPLALLPPIWEVTLLCKFVKLFTRCSDAVITTFLARHYMHWYLTGHITNGPRRYIYADELRAPHCGHRLLCALTTAPPTGGLTYE